MTTRTNHGDGTNIARESNKDILRYFAIPNRMELWRKLKKAMENSMLKNNWSNVVDNIIAGRHLFTGNSPFKSMREQVLESIDVNNDTYAQSTPLERIKVVNKYFDYVRFCKTLAKLDQGLAKNKKISKMLKKRGDKMYDEAHWGSALLCYNLALNYAPQEDKNFLAALFAKRSALFLRTMDIPLALKDIQDGLLVNPTNKKLIAQLENQKSVCLNFGSEDNLENERKADGKDQENKNYFRKVLFKIEEPVNPVMPSASACVRMVYSAERGRHLVATKDLEPGKTMIVEAPYVSVLDNSVEWEMKHCYSCYKRIWRTTPCLKCVFAVYCDEKCQSLDWEHGGHKYFCGCLPYTHAVELDSYDHLALKAICRAGPDYILKLYRKLYPKQALKKSEVKAPRPAPKALEGIKGFNPSTGIYSSDSYYQILNLISHVDHGENLDTLAFTAYTLAKVLKLRSDFFKFVGRGDERQFESYVATLIYQHLVSFPFNGVALRKSKGANQRAYAKIKQSKDEEGITAIFSLVSMMNHGCEPTIFWQQSENGTLAIVTKQRIRAGDDLFFSYGYNYTTWELGARKDAMLESYRIICNCLACQFEWPETHLIPEEVAYICPHCNQRSELTRKFLIEHCVLQETKNGKSGCGNCGKKWMTGGLEREAGKFERVMGKADELILRRKHLEAIPLIHECINYFHASVCPPSRNLLRSQDLLWLAYERAIDL